MILRNGIPYNSKEEAIATIKTSAFLAAPGGKAEGLADGEPILARYWAYFNRHTSGTEVYFTEEFPTSTEGAANYTFVRELDETTTDGLYRVIRLVFGVTTLYYDSSSQPIRQLEIFDNKDSIDERFAEIEAQIEGVTIDLTQTDATGTDATLLTSLTLADDGLTLHKAIAKIIGSNSVNVITTVNGTANPDEKNITLSLNLKNNGGLAEDSNGLYVKLTGTDNALVTTTDGLKVNPDNVTIGVKSNQLYVKHGTTINDTNGLDVNFDNTTIVQDSSNQLSVHYNTESMTYDDGLGVKVNGTTIKIDSNSGLYVPIDDNSIVYNSGSDYIEVNYDKATIVMGTNGLKVDYDLSTMTDSANGLGVKVDKQTIVIDSTNGLKVPIDGATIRLDNSQIKVNYDNKSIKYSGTDGLYVNAKANGGITIDSNGLSIGVSNIHGLEIPTTGTDANKIRVKVDGETIDFNSNGELIVKDALITDNFFDGQGIILEKDAAANTVKIIADVYNGNGTIGTSTDGVATRDILRFVNGAQSGTDNQVIGVKFGLKKLTTGLETNVREAYQLVDATGVGFGEQIKIYKDSSLIKTGMGHTPDDLVAAWESGSTMYYTCQGTTVEAGENINVYSDATCQTLAGTGTITNDGGNLVLVYSNQAYTPSENNFTTKEGTGTQNDALVFIYRLADGSYSLVTIDLESYLAENEFDDHVFEVTSAHEIFIKTKDSGGIEIGSGDDYDGLRIKLADGAGLSTTSNGLALDAATTTTLGGIKLFGSSDNTGTDNYRVQLDGNDRAYVNLSNFVYHHGLTITGDGTTILDAWNPSADGSITITSDDFISLTSAAGSMAIGINTSTDIANTTSTDALITLPTTQAVINYIDTASVIGQYTNPVYNTNIENPSVMDPTILNNVVYGENSSTDADTLTVAINKIDNKLASVFNALLDYEALNASAVESIRVNAGLGESYIYNPYANSVIEDATSLWEADKLLADRFLAVGTDIYNMHVEIANMGTDITNLQNAVDSMGTDISRMGTDITDLQNAVDSMGTDISRMGTDIADLQTAVDGMGTDIDYLMDNKLDELIGDNGIIVSAKVQTSTDVYKQTIKLDLAANMYTESGLEIDGLPSNLQFYGSSTDGNKKLVMTNVWDCGVY